MAQNNTDTAVVKNIELDRFSNSLALEMGLAIVELAKGGAIPIFVKNAGMIATITVSGLHDEADHAIIMDALKGKFF